MIGNYWYAERGGGLERYFCDLVQQLCAYGHEIDFFVYGKAPSEYYGARGFSLGSATSPLWRKLLTAHHVFRRAFSQSSSYDLIDSHFALTTLAAIAAIPSSIPIVGHFHGPWFLEAQAEKSSPLKVKLAYYIEKLVYSRCKSFITASQAFSQILIDHFSIPSSQIDAIPLSVNTEHFTLKNRQECRQQLHWDTQATIVFIARRLVHRVGITEMIHAAAQVAHYPKLKVLIAGRGPLQQNFQNLIDELGVGTTMSLIGYLSDTDLAQAYSAADLVVLPSQQLEGFGLAFAEALASGTPALVTPIGGMPEYVRPLSGALVTDTPAATSIAISLEALLSGKVQTPSAQECRTYALKQFSWSTLLPQIVTLYQKAATTGAA